MFSEFIQKRGDEFPFCVTLVDTSLPDQPLIYVNASFRNRTGYTNEEILGNNCRFLQNGKGDPEARKAIRTAIEKRRPIMRDLVNYKKNGEIFYNRLVLIPIKDKFPAYVGLQHQIPQNLFNQTISPDEHDILDRTLNPLTILLLSDMTSEEIYKSQFEQSTARLRNFILQH